MQLHFKEEIKVSEEIPATDIISFEEPNNSVSNEKTLNNDPSYLDNITTADRRAFKDLLEPKEVTKFNANLEPTTLAKQEEPKPEKVKRGLKVIKQESVVAKKNPISEQQPVKTDALEIKERIENRELDKVSKPAPIFNPATSNDVTEEYNDSNAPIDLNAFLNGNLAPASSKKDTVETNQDKKLTLSSDDNIDLMNFLNQIETNDSKAA